MAAKRRYATVPEQMVVLAREARAEGLSFDEFWVRAVRPGEPPIILATPLPWPESCVVWPSDSADRITWQSGTLGAEDGWRRAYEGIPASTSEKALKILEPLLTGGGLSAPLPERREPVAA